MTPAVSRVLEVLGDRIVGGQRSDGTRAARCPAHDDRRASLSISEGADGRALLHCHAGCEIADVMRAIGLTMADLMPPRDERRPYANGTSKRHAAPGGPNGGGGGARIVATYDYRDEDGELLYQVVRFEPKGFRQRRPNGNGWTWNLDGVRRVLYRLSELLAADFEAPMFLVEGEKDAETLARLGLCATTNAGGAGKWRAEYGEALRGRHVVVLPDNDDPGRKHAAEAAAALAGMAASIKVVELSGLPAKGDVSDWLAKGGTVRALLELAEKTPPRGAREPRQDNVPTSGDEKCSAADNAVAQARTLAPTRWPSRPEGAFYGPMGEAARAIEPLTEADPMAVLVQLVVAFGNAVGRGPRVVLGSIRQWANLFAVIVGKSSKSRKGTSWENASEIIAGADETWASDRIKSGLSSGEGVIHAVRDPIIIREPIRDGGKKTGRVLSYQEVEEDPGEIDKRLLVVEGEFARALKVASRKENVLSPVLRGAWDTGKLQTLTRSPYKATGAHVSIVGHITRDELRRELSACDSFNGFANRFLWICATRSKTLPFGETRIGEAAAGVRDRLARAARQARARGDDFIVGMDGACRNRWEEIYARLSADRAGLVGAILGRAEAQVLRLALVYALADAEDTIRLPHLEAALALWHYADESARVIFGDALGDAVADETLRALRDAPAGMTRDELRNHFDRHVPAPRMTDALRLLEEHGLARGQKEPPAGGKGRPAERWFAMPSPSAESAAGAESPASSTNYGANGANRADGQEDAEPPEEDDEGDLLPAAEGAQ